MSTNYPPSFDLCVCGLPTIFHRSQDNAALTCLELRQYLAQQLIQTPPALAEVLQGALDVRDRDFDPRDRRTWPETLTRAQLAAALSRSVSWLQRYKQRKGAYPVPAVEGQPHCFSKTHVVRHLDRINVGVKFFGGARRQRLHGSHPTKLHAVGGSANG
jgi:hypothetical protein